MQAGDRCKPLPCYLLQGGGRKEEAGLPATCLGEPPAMGGRSGNRLPLFCMQEEKCLKSWAGRGRHGGEAGGGQRRGGWEKEPAIQTCHLSLPGGRRQEKEEGRGRAVVGWRRAYIYLSYLSQAGSQQQHSLPLPSSLFPSLYSLLLGMHGMAALPSLSLFLISPLPQTIDILCLAKHFLLCPSILPTYLVAVAL